MHEILTTMFSEKSDGLPGNDDFGAMSSFTFQRSIKTSIHACSGGIKFLHHWIDVAFE